MSTPDKQLNPLCVGLLAPVELQKRGFLKRQIFTDLANRAFEPMPEGIKQIQPWCRWQGLSQYLDCLAFADRSAKEIPKGSALNLEHVTPGRFYSAGIIFFAHALVDNVAVWLCEAMSLSVAGGDRHFLSSRFKKELTKTQPAAAEELAKHDAFLREVNKYRQVWIHTISGGAIPLSDVSPFEHPDHAQKTLAVPIDPAIQPHLENWMDRAKQCANQNNGQCMYDIGDFTGRVFECATEFYCGWLRFALDHVS